MNQNMVKIVIFALTIVVFSTAASASNIESVPQTAPIIFPSKIWFNWGEGSGAITMYNPCTQTSLVTPEFDYKAGRNNPAAYVRGNFITIKVKFELKNLSITDAKVWANGSFGGMLPQTIYFNANESRWFNYTTREPIPDSIRINNVSWTWYYQIGSLPPVEIGKTNHTVYAFNKAPLTSKVYKELAEWTTNWSTGLPDDSKLIADAILNGFNKTGVIKYGSPGWDTAEILCSGDGMCGGMKEVFYDALATQGIHVTRFCYLLNDADPGPQTLWDGIVIQAPGLGRTQPTFSPRTVRWVDYVYPYPLYLGDSSPVDDVAVETKKVYTFYQGDGHCVNLLNYSGKVYLYDLSFGTGPWSGTFTSIPASGYYAGPQLHDFRVNYHDTAVDHMYGTIYYSDGTSKYKIGTKFDTKSSIIPDKIDIQDQIKYYFSVVK